MGRPYVLIFMGSPRRYGNSATLAQQVAQGADVAGADVECFYLHGMEIHPCTACDKCHEDTASDCVIDDDMRELYPKLRRADAIVIASPIYWFTMSAQTKLLIDRWYALGGPQGYALRGKRFGIVLTYEDDDPFASGAVNALRTFQDAASFLGAEIAGYVYGRAAAPGEIKANADLMEKAFVLGQALGRQV
jgi:multimeric flavodoxin WrbA